MARLRRLALALGALPVRTWEASSAKVVSHMVQPVLDRPVPAQQFGQPGGAGLRMGQAGDRIDGGVRHRLQPRSRSLRVIWRTWEMCGNSPNPRTLTALRVRISTRPWERSSTGT